MSIEAMKLALEALENWVEYFPQNVDDIDKKAITSLREELSKPDFWEGYVPEPVKPKEDVTLIDEGKTAQQEFVSPGGGYVPAIPVQQRPIKTFHGGKAWPVQEPAQPVPDAFEQLMREADKPTQVPEEIAKCVNALMDGTHEITSVTIRPKRTWVGLTDDEKLHIEIMGGKSDVMLAEMVEAKLKEKNT
jgi:hypothetical protein